MKKIKITKAYCIELDAVMDIDQVHEESMKGGMPYRSFEFLCSDLKCREMQVKITGVNYDKPVSQQLHAMHFRENHKHSHHPNCEWVILNKYLTYPACHPGETEKLSEIRQRTSSSVTDWIVKYTPYLPDTGVSSDSGNNEYMSNNPNHSSRSQSQNTVHTGTHGRTTHSFQRICQFHFEMSQILPDFHDLQEISLYVTGIGQTNLYKYFQLMKYGLRFDKRHEYNCILFGKLSHQKGILRYGIGFRIRFLAKINKMAVTIYISSEQIRNYRHRNALLDILNNYDKFENLTAYFVPKPNIVIEYELNSGQRELQITISDLNYFRIIGTLKKN